MNEKLQKTPVQEECKKHGDIHFYVNIMDNILRHQKIIEVMSI